MGESDEGALRFDFNRPVLLQFRDSTIASDADLLTYRELNEPFGLIDTGTDTLADACTGKNGQHRLAGLLRQSVFGRLATGITKSAVAGAVASRPSPRLARKLNLYTIVAAKMFGHLANVA